MKEELLSENYKILEHYGIYKQITIWIEEMSELTKELCKWQRNYDNYEGDIPVLLMLNLHTEVTDVQVSLDQIKKAINYNELDQESDYKFKIERQLERIKGE